MQSHLTMKTSTSVFTYPRGNIVTFQRFYTENIGVKSLEVSLDSLKILVNNLMYKRNYNRDSLL